MLAIHDKADCYEPEPESVPVAVRRWCCLRSAGKVELAVCCTGDQGTVGHRKRRALPAGMVTGSDKPLIESVSCSNWRL